jgi:hypothetical protein
VGIDGYPDGFEDRLSNLMHGFTRVLRQHDQDDGGDVSEGKGTMSVDLCFSLCRWFLEKGTLEGVWCHCFIIVTWNLMCYMNYTTQTCLNHITWYQNCLRVNFKQQKSDQLGSTAWYPRHIYANPLVTLWSVQWLHLGFFLIIWGTTGAYIEAFPWSESVQAFWMPTERTLKEHIDEVHSFGFEVLDIETHSIPKGAMTYLNSQPGSPAPASICIRAGWTLGGIKDIYIKYEQSGGDMFCG